jgi:transcription antitermination factor NusG
MRWFIAECMPSKEKTVRTLLQGTGYEAYLASQSETVVYKCRNRRVKEKVIIPGKVFVHTEESNLMSIMLAHSSVWRFMLDRTTKDRRFAFVTDDEMQNLQYMLGSASNPVLITADKLKVGQKVKVMRGALAGLEGWFYREGHTSFIVIKVTMGTNHYVYTEVPIEDITPLDPTQHATLASNKKP